MIYKWAIFQFAMLDNPRPLMIFSMSVFPKIQLGWATWATWALIRMLMLLDLGSYLIPDPRPWRWSAGIFSMESWKDSPFQSMGNSVLLVRFTKGIFGNDPLANYQFHNPSNPQQPIQQPCVKRTSKQLRPNELITEPFPSDWIPTLGGGNHNLGRENCASREQNHQSPLLEGVYWTFLSHVTHILLKATTWFQEQIVMI